MTRRHRASAGMFASVGSTWIIPFLAPMVGAVAAFCLNRGSRLRRARTAALEDLQLHDRAKALLGANDPMIDQIKAHARESVRVYATRRAAHAKRLDAWLSAAAIIVTSLVLGTVIVALDLQDSWVLLALGVIGGLVGIGTQGALERVQVGLALRKVPTEKSTRSPDAA